MRMKRIELVGFKSFVDRTVIEFQHGITGIVGPNGCGKSNVVDAIRWVLGEQSSKNLRGKSMEDVIFAGSESRSPLGMAEVILTFDNQDGRIGGPYASFGEISIGRRLFRSGESEYLVNKSAVRLRDVQEIFMDTGVGSRAHYAIIEQGKIGFVLSAKPEDRRILIEEAAGISKFRARKVSALRKIESTKQNLLRVQDVVAEVKRQMDYTQRQAAKARKYSEVKAQARDLDLQLWKVDYRQIASELAQLENDKKGLLESEESLKIRLSQKESHIETLRLNILDIEKQLQTTQEQFYQNQNQIRLIENSKGHLQSQAQDLTERQQKNLEEATHLNAQLEHLSVQLGEAEIEMQDLQAEDSRLKGLLAESESCLSILRQQISDLNQHIESLQAEQSLRQSQLTNCETLIRKDLEVKNEMVQRIEATRKEFSDISDRVIALKTHFKSQEAEVEGLKQMQLELGSKAKQSGEDLESFISQRTRVETELNEKRQNATSLISRHQVLSELEKNYEGLQEGPKALLQHHRSEGFLGLIAELISVPKAYEAAAEAVFGEHLQVIVAKAQGDIQAALQQLREGAMGRASFLAMSMASNIATAVPPRLPQGQGILGFLDAFVESEPQYASLVSSLLYGVVLVEDFSAAIELWSANPNQFTLVTLQGEMIDRRGVISGGSAKRPESGPSLLGRKTAIRELTGNIENLKQDIANLEQEHFRLNAKISAHKMETDSLFRNHQEETLRLVQRQKDVSVVREEINRYEELYQQLHRRMADDEETLRRVTQEISDTESRLSQVQSELTTMAKTLETLQSQHGLRTEDFTLAQNTHTTQQILCAEVKQKVVSLARDLGRMQSEVVEKQNQKTEIEQVNAKLKTTFDEIEVNVERLTAEGQELVRRNTEVETALATIRNEYQERAQDIKDHEEGLRLLRKDQEQNTRALNETVLRFSEIQNKSDRMIEKINLEFSGQLETLIAESLQGEGVSADVSEIREQLNALDQQLRAMGEVNLSAMNEFEQLSKRHSFLVRQKEDLELSIDALQKTIQKVNRTSRERFKETFDAVKAKFEEIFPRLFGGGKASLSLTQEDDVLEAGIEILCQPPGKKIQNVELLSGGEKALASICLILGIFLIKPSPFCLLDEVDAPLDDANITRFNELLHELAKESQLLLITHNRHTMEIADHLYGVTMQEAGVSKTVSVELN